MTSVCLFGIVSAAYAEKWATVFEDDQNEMYGTVDLDSIRKGNDGLIYFTERSDIGESQKAVDCKKRISYLLGKGSYWKNPDWKSKGSKIVPGSNGARMADFVCARAR